MTHLAGFMQLAESETHEEHGVDAAQHPGQLLLVCLQQQDSFPLFVPWLFPFCPLVSLFCPLVSLNLAPDFPFLSPGLPVLSLLPMLF